MVNTVLPLALAASHLDTHAMASRLSITTAYSRVSNTDPSGFHVADDVAKNAAVVQPWALDALDFVRVRFDAPWPVNIVIDDAAMDAYNQVGESYSDHCW